MIDIKQPNTQFGRGAYDTTGVPKPPPRPRPSGNPIYFTQIQGSLTRREYDYPPSYIII